MSAAESQAFSSLFKSVCARCFGRALAQPLTEPESRHLSHAIEERTGLVIGWKSLKNYSVFVLNDRPEKTESPSVATLDTLARYLAEAPATTEAQRKREGSHHGYWFRYLENVGGQNTGQADSEPPARKRSVVWLPWAVLATLTAAFLFFAKRQPAHYSTDFQSLEDDFLEKNGWFVLAKDTAHWRRRNEQPGSLTLFTLGGDNWHSRSQTPVVRNLLVRKNGDDCFSTEVHFNDFIPQENWQQAGLLLLEDTVFSGKSLRLSLAYNDFFGGYAMPGEIIVQGVADFGQGNPNVEEVLHHRLFSAQEADSGIVKNNLRFSALRIEKRGKRFRFLAAASPLEHFSYKELGTYNFDFEPRYVGIFALKGFVDSSAVAPVRVRFFGLEGVRCQ
jgi:hypothetical protein